MTAFDRERMLESPPKEQRRAPYGRRESQERALRAYEGETYYGRPAIKPSYYGWLIVCYFFVGGMAGAAQLIAAIADLFGRDEDRALARAGRYLAVLGALVSPALLIADLHLPRRWYNMLRIFRPTSAMSIGAWTLALFGTLSGLTAVAQALEDLFGSAAGRWLARLFGVPAALAGAMMSIYTGALLSATSVPLWSAATRTLSALFGASSAANASAALTLILAAAGAPARTLRRLERLALAVGGAELVLALVTARQWRRQGVAAPLQSQPVAATYRFGVLGLGILAPLITHAAHILWRRDSHTLPVAAAVATLLGGFAQRAVIIVAGNASAVRPADYFRFTQPDARRGDGAASNMTGGRP